MPAPDHVTRQKARRILCVLLAVWAIAPSAARSGEPISPALVSDAVAGHAALLATIDSNSAAMTLFTTSIGPSLGLRDAAKTLGVKGLPEKSVKELGLAELSQTVHQLMGALSAWQLADAIGRTGENRGSPTTASMALPPTARQDWLKESSHVASLTALFGALQEQQAEDPERLLSPLQQTQLLLAANRVAFEASQRATTAWWELHRWKDRVRQAWGQSRLCGTWQWVIHNHQNHREQKTVLLFPPAGQVPANSPLPVETVVLGDSIYLRWEEEGRIQEDSLLFLKDGTRVEGSFENNTGGWGSITGKRTAGCQP
ncbi:MAG: hypothetical protein ACT4O4_09515 [Nitrospiraceae bacterium]